MAFDELDDMADQAGLQALDAHERGPDEDAEQPAAAPAQDIAAAQAAEDRAVAMVNFRDWLHNATHLPEDKLGFLVTHLDGESIFTTGDLRA